jgi:hypothetical protein
VKIGVEYSRNAVDCDQVTIGAVKALFKGVNDFAGVFYILRPSLAKNCR